MADCYYFLDFEASGLLPGSYPIEVAVVRNDGWYKRWLIAPHHEWLHGGSWDPNAEAMHGLSLEDCLQQGAPVHAVAKELLDIIHGQVVFSDAPGSDAGWLDTLLDYGDHKERVQLHDVESCWGSIVRPMIESGEQKQAAFTIQAIVTEYQLFVIQLEHGLDEKRDDPERKYLRHRALADALTLQRITSKIQSAVDHWSALRGSL